MPGYCHSFSMPYDGAYPNKYTFCLNDATVPAILGTELALPIPPQSTTLRGINAYRRTNRH